MLYDLLDRKGATLLYQPKRVQEQVAARQPRQQWVNWIGLAVLVGVAYFLAARLSLLLLTKPDGVAVFWDRVLDCRSQSGQLLRPSLPI